ncbi:acetylxylan esterase [Actinacidiphila alni]|uniref:acetylxylan esterase n=1 Tax=Actinacidiphila alni TaxID=380248 RepID=UPI003455881D
MTRLRDGAVTAVTARGGAPVAADAPYDGRVTEELLRGPEDFDAFWQAARDEAAGVDPAPRRVEVLHRNAREVVTRVAFRTTGGLTLGGWLREPADGAVDRLLVRLHGYGGSGGPPEALGLPHTAELSPVLRGLPELGLVDGIPPVAAEHVLHGIGRRETYVHRGCVQDVWLAVTAACLLQPSGAGRVGLTGSSFGGGIGALALPLESRAEAACLDVPSFGNHPERLRTPCAGSGEAVRLAARADPSVRRTIAYFDAATAAARVTRPVLIAAARHDPVVPPVGQFAVFRALGGPKALLALTAGHLEHPGRAAEERLTRGAFAQWLRDPPPAG